jgi:hypothetical protein
VNAYKFQYPSVENVKQHFHPKAEVEKLTQSESPIEKAINNYSIKVIQSKQIPSDLLLKIQNTIKAFNEDIMISNDPLKFKTQ